MGKYKGKGTTFILGCTELSVIFEEKNDSMTDPMDVLAAAAIKKCGKRARKIPTKT